MVVSAISLTGMNTINLSDVNTAQQVQLYVLMIIGSPILVSIVVLYIRKKDFKRTARSKSSLPSI
jgi:ABC-type arginine/histidine transport system permease subunit